MAGRSTLCAGMFRIDEKANSIVPSERRSFSELNFRERAHSQEWIAKQPSCLGEELLIIQKEFAGFSDSFGVRPVPFIIGK
jgi:hypothetical protein